MFLYYMKNRPIEFILYICDTNKENIIYIYDILLLKSTCNINK